MKQECITEENTITITDSDSGHLENLRYCILATTKEETRYSLHLLEVKNGVCSATDGHRLHQAFTKLEDGYYQPVKVLNTKIILEKVNEDKACFPDVYKNTVWPDHCKARIITTQLLSRYDKSLICIFLAKIIRAMPKQYTINPEYIKDLGSSVWTAYLYQNGLVAFTDTVKWAIMMPIDIKASRR